MCSMNFNVESHPMILRNKKKPKGIQKRRFMLNTLANFAFISLAARRRTADFSTRYILKFALLFFAFQK